MASLVSGQFFGGKTGQEQPSMECAAHGGAVADAKRRWPAPRSARRQSGVTAAAVHKRTTRSQIFMRHDTRH
jgi:hypothetical protein